MCLTAACAPAEVEPAEAGAMLRAAAGEMIRDIARNPGPIVMVCVGYVGDSGPSDVPEAPTGSIRVGPLDACEIVDGRLRARDGGGAAVSVSLALPERTSESTARVRAITSTGSGDMAAYACTLDGGRGSWRTRECALEAVS